MFQTVGLVARVDRKKALDLAVKLSRYIEKRGLTVFLEPALAEYAQKPDASMPLGKMKTDLIITVGGDGTILNTCLQIPKPEPPILAINMGVRGFLTEVTPKDAFDALDKCLEGTFTLERCFKLASFIGKRRLPDALNEVFITSLSPAKLLHMRVWKNGVPVADCRSDGAVVASQVGSTGYSLSAGGPVLDSDLDAFVFTPICPLTVFHPVVFSAKSSVGIELLNPKRALVVVDGHYRAEMKPKEARITVVRSEYESSFVRFREDFYRRLKGRLLFSRGRGS
ncbi:MAG: NAD(+)/NADH kinase [Candidatus Bathyarchaeia archaeon]